MSRILLVEDDDDMRLDLAELLREEGHVVATAANGQEALDWLRDQAPSTDLILLDLMMPVMSGWEFRTRQLAEPRTARIPVVVMTGVDLRRADADLQAAAYFVKPLDLDGLLRAVRRLSGPVS